jgi:hypothetical protein
MLLQGFFSIALVVYRAGLFAKAPLELDTETYL